MIIKSTVVGFIGTLFGNLVFFILLLYGASSLDAWLQGILLEHGASQISELPRYDHMPHYLLLGGKWVLWSIAALAAYEFFVTIFYSSRETNKLTHTGVNWRQIEKQQYGFPASRNTKLAVINRVTEVSVNESTFDRIFGTGTLNLTLTVFLNATETQIKWEIPAINDPHTVANQIRAKSPDHDGARVTFERIPQT